jgi:hypothetical protein
MADNKRIIDKTSSTRGGTGKTMLARQRTGKMLPTQEIASKAAPQGRPGTNMRQISAIGGAILVGVALLWFLWFYVRQANPALATFTWPILNAHNTAVSTPDPLLAAGITVVSASQSQQPLIGRQQALLLADQMQPGVAAKAGGVSLDYVLCSYHNPNPTSIVTFQNTLAWVIHYTKVSEPNPDTSADPKASANQHDVYVFLDANSGKELLTIWV